MQNKKNRSDILRACVAHFVVSLIMIQIFQTHFVLVNGWGANNLSRFSFSVARTSLNPGRPALLSLTTRFNKSAKERMMSFTTNERFSAAALYFPMSHLHFSNTNDSCIDSRAFHRHQRVHPLLCRTCTPHRIRFFATNEIDADKDDNYTDSEDEEARSPYHTKWIVPAGVFIPEEQLKIKYVRSSGAGGQNVNKVSSCVQVRFHVMSAEWMGPYEVRERFMHEYKNQISRDGIYQTESQAHRTQHQNRKDALQKIEQAVLAVWPRPKLRRVRVGLSEKGERKRKEEKTKQSSKKESRRNYRYDF